MIKKKIEEAFNKQINEQWFVDEQVEEEANFTELVDKLKMISDHNPLLLMQDKEMGQRIPGPNPFFNTGAEQ